MMKVILVLFVLALFSSADSPENAAMLINRHEAVEASETKDRLVEYKLKRNDSLNEQLKLNFDLIKYQRDKDAKEDNSEEEQ